MEFPVAADATLCYIRCTMSRSQNHYILFFKPYGVITQFSREGNHPTLKDFGPFPPGVYPVGRLDAESEGLLLLTDDNRVKHHLTEPRFGHERTYLVQVERIPLPDALGRLQTGVVIEGKATKPARVRLLDHDPLLPPRPVPIRYRKNVPTSWLELTLSEGRNRQVRKMTASVGHPTLRLVRIRIDVLTLGDLKPGEWRHLSSAEEAKLRKNVESAGSLQKNPSTNVIASEAKPACRQAGNPDT
jgi:23S rRNA pseudouridine2457 synthase